MEEQQRQSGASSSSTDDHATNNDAGSQSTGNKNWWELTGRAKEALEVYRERVKVLKKAEQRKPDMVAYKELKSHFTPEKRHGELKGVPTGGLVLTGWETLSDGTLASSVSRDTPSSLVPVKQWSLWLDVVERVEAQVTKTILK